MRKQRTLFLLVLTTCYTAGAQPLSDGQAKRILPPNTCAIRCPEGTGHSPQAALQVCRENATPICQCDTDVPMATCESSKLPINRKRYRRVFTEENAPQHIRFKVLIRAIDQEGIIASIDYRPGFDPSKAAEMVEYLVSLRAEIEKEIENLEIRMLCLPPRPSGSDIGHAYNALEDAPDLIYEKYLRIASGDLGVLRYHKLVGLFMDWGGFSIMYSEHTRRETHKLEMRLEGFCDAVDTSVLPPFNP